MISKIYLGVCSLLFACFLVCGSILTPVVTYASPYDLLIETNSNAVMMMTSSSRSSLASVNNTVDYDSVDLYVRLIDTESGRYSYENPNIVDDDGNFIYYVPSGYELDMYGWRLKRGALPSPGKYRFQLDFSSDASVEYVRSSLVSTLKKNNVALDSISVNILPYCQQNAGDLYSDFVIDLGAIDTLRVSFALSDSLSAGSIFAGTVKFAFSITDADVDVSVISSQGSSSDYEFGVTSSLSDLSSSVESVEEEISFVTQAIQTLQGAMEPHYDNVLTQLHHITEQLHAFYDQVYNNIHLPELDMLTQIRTAIENIDLQIEVDISEVKTAINNMSTAVQNKLQSTTDQITGGYDNSQQTQQNQQLQDSINAYDEVEEDIFEDVDGFMQEFEYPSFDSMNGSVIKALAFIGGFLQSIFLCMGDFGVIITFSLTMIFVMIIVGYHRIRS